MAWLMLRRSLTRRRSRVLIAVLAVAIGSTTIFALALLAIDIPRHMSQDMRSLGANLIVLPADGSPALSASTVEEIKGVLTDSEVVSVVCFRYANVRLNQQPFLAAGTDLAQAQKAKGYWDVEGDWPDQPGQVLIGRDVASLIGLAPGDTVTVTLTQAVTAADPTDPSDQTDPDGQAPEPPAERSARLSVRGILTTGGNEDGFVVMDLSDLERLTLSFDLVDIVELSIDRDSASLAELAQTIDRQVDQVSAAPVRRLAHSEADVLAMLRSLLALVAVIVLALTLIGVATTMMAVVTERRAEIALRKALGADQRSIAWEFQCEAMVLGLVGGLLGAGLGFGLAQAISQSVFQRGVAFSGWLAAVTVAASVLIAYLASRQPVRRATLVDPALVLREE
jgi:putative ABC transport system permease protein